MVCRPGRAPWRRPISRYRRSMAIRALLSNRQFGADRQAPQHPALAVIIVDREMLATAVVPDADRALLPAQAGGEFRPGAMRLQEIDQRPAFLVGPVLAADRVARIDVERLLAGLGMGAHDRVLRHVAFGVIGVAHLHVLVFGAAAAAAVAPHPGAVNADEPAEHRLHAGRQCLVGEVLVRHHRVAAERRHLTGVQHRADRRAFGIGRVRLPGAADILLLVGLFAQFEDLREAGHAFDKGIIRRLGEVPGETQHVGGAELLVAHIDREVSEEGVVDLRPGPVAEGLAQIDAADLGAESAGEGTHRDRLVIHRVLLRRRARQKGNVILSASAHRRRPPAANGFCDCPAEPHNLASAPGNPEWERLLWNSALRSFSPITRSLRPNWRSRWRNAASTPSGPPSIRISRCRGGPGPTRNWASATTM